MTEAKNRRSDTVWTSEANTLYPSLKRELKQAGCFDRVNQPSLHHQLHGSERGRRTTSGLRGKRSR